jgi:hypothetical protein
MDSPWKRLIRVDPGKEYLALLTYLPLRSYRKIPGFLRYSLQVQRQMRETPGAVGYSFRAKVLTRNFWTFSVWENDRALMDFVAKVPHGEAMKSFRPYMGTTKFTRWKLPGSAVPPSWHEAMKREAQER